MTKALRVDKEFRDMVRGTHASCDEFRAYVLAELRLARRRVLLLVKEIDMIGLAVKSKIVEPEAGIEWLAELGALEFLIPTEPEGNNVEIFEGREVESVAAGDSVAAASISGVG